MKLPASLVKVLARSVEGIQLTPSVGGGVFGSSPTAGVKVTQDSALALAAMWGCLRYISGSVGVMPWGVYRAQGAARSEERKHQLWTTLHDRPSPLHSPQGVKEALVWNAALVGNGYAEVVGKQLYLLDPSGVTPWVTPQRGALYEYKDPQTSETRWMLPSQVLHIKGPSRDGVIGMSVISAAREAISSGLSLQTYAAAFFGNGTHVGGVYEVPNTLTDEQFERLKAQIDAEKGSRNSHKPRILEGGMKYSADTIPPQDAQFLEQRKFSAREVCGLFGVPPHKVGLEEGATAYASREQAAIEAVVDCLLPWVTRIEQEGNYKLLTPAERAGGLYTKMTMDVLLRGDAKSRAEANQIRFRNGALSSDEWRAQDELAPVDGGDEPLVSRDLIPLSKAKEYAESQTKKNDPAPPPPKPDGEPEDDPPDDDGADDALDPLIEEAKARISARFADDDYRKRDRSSEFVALVLSPIADTAARLGIPFDSDAVIADL
jgi:HK97 family phage portal protein